MSTYSVTSPVDVTKAFDSTAMSDPDEIVDMFLKFPNGLSSSQKSDYERCSSRPSARPRVKKRCLRRSERKAAR